MIGIGSTVLVGTWLLGVPIFVALGLGSLIILVWGLNVPLASIANLSVGALNSYSLLAIPLYMFAGNLMSEGKSVGSLLKFFSSVLGHWPGGLGIIAVVTCTFFAAVSGVTTATIIAVGAMVIPSMISAGYSKGSIGGLLAVAGTLGSLIPPSVGLIIYGDIVEASVGDLFVGAILPGLFISALLIATVMLMAKYKKWPRAARSTWKECWKAFIEALPALFMPLIILGGIYSGIFTPTEAASVACVYSAFIGIFVYRGLKWDSFKRGLGNTVIQAGMILILISTAVLLGVVFNYTELPQRVTQFAVSFHVGREMFLLIFIALNIALGTFMEAIPQFYVTLPILWPVAKSLGIDPIHLGIINQIGINIGQVSPPVAIALWAAQSITGARSGDIFKESLPFLAAYFIGMIVVTFWPGIVLILPKLMHG